MTIKQLKTQFKEGVFAKLYLFVGEEDFLIESYVKTLKTSLVDDSFEMFNYVEFEGGVDLALVKDEINQYPQMSDKKVIVLKNSGLIGKRNKQVEEMIEAIPEYACVVFIEPSITKVSKPILKIIEGIGEVVEFGRQGVADLRKWVAIKLNGSAKKMSEDDINYMIEVCDKSLQRLNTELEKLISASEGEVIERAVINSLVSVSPEYKMFVFIDRLLDGDGDYVYKAIADFKTAREPAVVIISNIYLQVASLVMVKRLMACGVGSIGDYFAPNRRFLAGKLAKCASRYDIKKLEKVEAHSFEYDYKIKSGRIDEWAALEIIMAEMLA
ncbi:MAG: DNA polymerase III subunit delta [Clostridiales bacterium]|jgi:DNA polymerase-3 subunit delta|nr:DNA polymerase III subunit delta [Clostridiales bacterium]